jgi:hypothetical protein
VSSALERSSEATENVVVNVTTDIKDTHSTKILDKVHAQYNVYILNNETIHTKDTISIIETTFIKILYTHQIMRSSSTIHTTSTKDTGLEFKASLL